MTALSPAAGRWLFGPVPDLLLGCGLWYMALFALLALAGPELLSHQPRFLIPILMVTLSMPHYGATLMRVYDQRNDRRRYAVFAVWVTLAIAVFFVVGLHDTFVASLMLTIYLTWSPWHYTGQNYGLALLFLRRTGTAVTVPLKRLVYATFLISYGMVFTAFHSALGTGALQYAADGYGDSQIAFLSLGIPLSVTNTLFAVLGVAYVATIAMLARALLRTTSARELLPMGMLVLTQALWFTIPVGLSYAGMRTGIDPIDNYARNQNYVFFVALGHAVQYLWVTTYYARGSQGWRGYGPYLGKILASGIAIWTLPILLFSVDLLGPVSSAAGLAVLTASAVNLHHFILDGAIWKLRDGRIARVLLRAPSEERAGGDEERAAGSWIRPAVWTCLVSWVALQLLGTLEYEYGARPAMRAQPVDVERLQVSASRLRWIGKDDPDIHFQLGAAAGERGDLVAARREFERANELQENAQAWVGLAYVEVQQGRREAAQTALERALRVEPDNVEAWVRASGVWRALGDAERAKQALARAVELAPARGDLRAQLAGFTGTQPGS